MLAKHKTIRNAENKTSDSDDLRGFNEFNSSRAQPRQSNRLNPFIRLGDLAGFTMINLNFRF